LSALPISLRAAWSYRLAHLLAPAGVLICVEWPSYKDPKAGGPPWPLPPYIYTAHLPRPGQEESKDGLHRIAHFHPKRTHNAGVVDGTITDYVGVWKHKLVA
jgi:hypothetical protein